MAEENNTDNTPRMVISPNPHRTFFKTKKFWSVLIVVVIIFAGATVATIKMQTKTKKPVAQTKAKPKTYADVSKDSLALTGTNKPADAAKAWEDYLKSNPAKADQYNAYKQLGVSYLNASEYDKARDAFSKAKAISNNNDTQILSALAQIDEKEGHTQIAIDEYKNIITILQTNIKTQDSVAQFQTAQDITTLQRTIQRLGGTP